MYLAQCSTNSVARSVRVSVVSVRDVMVRRDVSLFPSPLLFRPGTQALPPTTIMVELNRTVSCTTATRGDIRVTAGDIGSAGDGASGGGLAA